MIKHEGSLIDPERLKRLAFGEHDDKTDNERELRVALQDALVLAGIYRGGQWTECVGDGNVIFYRNVDLTGLDQLEVAELEAWPAPWIQDPREPKYIRDSHNNRTIGCVNLSASDAELIVKMRNALPLLINSRGIARRR